MMHSANPRPGKVREEKERRGHRGLLLIIKVRVSIDNRKEFLFTIETFKNNEMIK